MKVRVPSALQGYTGASEVEASGGTLTELFDDLERRYPGLRFRVVDEQQRLRANLRIFVDGRGVRDLGHALAPDARVDIVLALSGGRAVFGRGEIPCRAGHRPAGRREIAGRVTLVPFLRTTRRSPTP